MTYIQVALFTRAWIEISVVWSFRLIMPSPSSRGRGLKCAMVRYIAHIDNVALFTRAWIEINIWGEVDKLWGSRPLHEGVD